MFGYMTELETVEIKGTQLIEAQGENHTLDINIDIILKC
jgi:hypothetical protein